MRIAKEYRDLIAAMDRETLDALIDYATDHGRNWRSDLRAVWDAGLDIGPLRRVRNTLGPSGIKYFQVQS